MISSLCQNNKITRRGRRGDGDLIEQKKFLFNCGESEPGERGGGAYFDKVNFPFWDLFTALL